MALSKIVLTIDLGGPRWLDVHENNEIIITDRCSKKCVFFTGPCWKRFVGMMADIDEHVQLVSAGVGTQYMQTIGGTWQVSVNNTFPIVDIRRWYNKTSIGVSLKPTAVGIAFTYPNCNKLKKAAIRVENEIPTMSAISPCLHDSHIEQMICDECTPYYNPEETSENLMIDTNSSTSDNAVEH